MHKVRLSQNNYQLVAENSGQSPEVLMSNYNEILDTEKRESSQLVEKGLYPGLAPEEKNLRNEKFDAEGLLDKIKTDPDFSRQLLQLLLRDADKAS